MADLPRYVQKMTRKDRTVYYRYNPPKRYIELGLVTRQNLAKDLRVARRLAGELNAKIEAWQEIYAAKKRLTANATIHKLIAHYQQSFAYTSLTIKSQKEYNYVFSNLETDIQRRSIGSITVQDARHLYDKWLHRGVYHANRMGRIASVLFNYALDHRYIPMNPFSRLRKHIPKPRKTVWTDEQVKKFLDVCYSDFKWRNVGLIFQMTYAWVQRIGDIRLLTWDAINFEDRIVTINQSKRKATVYIPIADDLFSMLQTQHNDFGFQQYVAPKVKPRRGIFHPYSPDNISTIVRAILEKAGLPPELRASDLRRTGTTQMVEGGVPTTSIMQVTGHVNPSSLKPYLKNTVRGAAEALSNRVY